MMVVAIASLPTSLGCQMHICKLVAGKAPSFEKPSSELQNQWFRQSGHVSTRWISWPKWFGLHQVSLICVL
jgi:hypothetical protein